MLTSATLGELLHHGRGPGRAVQRGREHGCGEGQGGAGQGGRQLIQPGEYSTVQYSTVARVRELAAQTTKLHWHCNIQHEASGA